jgi:predicted O-methyltransferase YrrM
MATLLRLPATGRIQFTEGNCTQVPQQMDRLHELVETYKPARILEIGFNAGHSAEVMLRAHPGTQVVSVDIGAHDYVRTAKHAIDRFYPRRHTLILGDSTQAIPNLAEMMHGRTPSGAPQGPSGEVAAKGSVRAFDLIFIDGGHDYPVATADLLNCRALSHPDTVVIMDDTYRSDDITFRFNRGPTRAWDEAEAAGSVERIGADEYCPGRGMTWGKYVGW